MYTCTHVHIYCTHVTHLIVIERHSAGAVTLHVGGAGVCRNLRVLLRDVILGDVPDVLDLILRTVLHLDLGWGGVVDTNLADILLCLD